MANAPSVNLRRRNGDALVLESANVKGGVGKTTLALALSGELALRGYHVLLIGTDFNNPALKHYFQHSHQLDDEDPFPPDRTSCWLFGKGNDYTHARWNFALNPAAKGADNKPRYDQAQIERAGKERGWLWGVGRLDIIPDHGDLGQIAQQMDRDPNRQEVNLRLRTAIQQARRDYDVIIFDTPPARMDINPIASNIAFTTDYVILPFLPDVEATSAAREDIKRVAAVSRTRMLLGLDELRVLGVVGQAIALDDGDHRGVLKSMRSSRIVGPYLCRVTIPEDRAPSKAQFASDLFQLMKPYSPAAEALPLLVDELLGRLA